MQRVCPTWVFSEVSCRVVPRGGRLAGFPRGFPLAVHRVGLDGLPWGFPGFVPVCGSRGVPTAFSEGPLCGPQLGTAGGPTVGCRGWVPWGPRVFPSGSPWRVPRGGAPETCPWGCPKGVPPGVPPCRSTGGVYRVFPRACSPALVPPSGPVVGPFVGSPVGSPRGSHGWLNPRGSAGRILRGVPRVGFLAEGVSPWGRPGWSTWRIPLCPRGVPRWGSPGVPLGVSPRMFLGDSLRVSLGGFSSELSPGVSPVVPPGGISLGGAPSQFPRGGSPKRGSPGRGPARLVPWGVPQGGFWWVPPRRVPPRLFVNVT